jgi:antitoxin component YwqK of YwqJK toxin-antitoxin module
MYSVVKKILFRDKEPKSQRVNYQKMKDGVYKEYYYNGNLYMICNYVAGKKDGDCFEYHENGKLYVSSTYCNGKLEGQVRVYTDNGILSEILNYKNGVKI